MTSFADITTMGVGGPIAHFIEPTTRVGLIEAVEEADSKGLPLVVVGAAPTCLFPISLLTAWWFETPDASSLCRTRLHR